MMPVVVLMERKCNEGCAAPSALLVLHNAFINLIEDTRGLHRHDICVDHHLYEKIHDHLHGWHHLPWSGEIPLLHLKHMLHPVYEWLNNNALNMTQECIDMDMFPIELQILLQNIHQLTGHTDNFWSFEYEDLIDIHWDSIYVHQSNHWIKRNNWQQWVSPLKEYGFGKMDFNFFEHLSLNFESPCR